MVLVAPRIRANRTSTPPSARPQKALQKSSDGFCGIGELSLAYLDSDVVEADLLVDIVFFLASCRPSGFWDVEC